MAYRRIGVLVFIPILKLLTLQDTDANKVGLEHMLNQGKFFPLNVLGMLHDQQVINVQEKQLPNVCVTRCGTLGYEYAYIRAVASAQFKCVCAKPKLLQDSTIVHKEADRCPSSLKPCGSFREGFISVYCTTKDSCAISDGFYYWGCVYPLHIVIGNEDKHFVIDQTNKSRCLSQCANEAYNLAVIDNSDTCLCLRKLSVSLQDMGCDCAKQWCPPLAGPCGLTKSGYAVYCRGLACNTVLISKYARYSPSVTGSLYNIHELEERNIKSTTLSFGLNGSEVPAGGFPRAGLHNKIMVTSQVSNFPKCITEESIQLSKTNWVSKHIVTLPDDCISTCKEMHSVYVFIWDTKCRCGNTDALHKKNPIVNWPSYNNPTYCNICPQQNNKSLTCGGFADNEQNHGSPVYSVYCTDPSKCLTGDYLYWGCVRADSVNILGTESVSVGGEIGCLTKCSKMGKDIVLLSSGAGSLKCLCSANQAFSRYDMDCRCNTRWCPPLAGACGGMVKNEHVAYSVYCHHQKCEDLLHDAKLPTGEGTTQPLHSTTESTVYLRTREKVVTSLTELNSDTVSVISVSPTESVLDNMSLASHVAVTSDMAVLTIEPENVTTKELPTDIMSVSAITSADVMSVSAITSADVMSVSAIASADDCAQYNGIADAASIPTKCVTTLPSIDHSSHSTKSSTAESQWLTGGSSSCKTCEGGHCCLGYDKRGNFWVACAGKTAEHECPMGSSGAATWMCHASTLTFYPEQPDRSRCRDEWIEDLLNPEVSQSVIAATAEKIDVHTSNTTNITGGTIMDVVELMGRLLKVEEQEGYVETEDEWSWGFTSHFIHITSNLLSNDTPWLELPPETRTTTASFLLSHMEFAAFLYLSSIHTNSTSSQRKLYEDENILVTLCEENKPMLNQSLVFPSKDHPSWIRLPPGYHTLLETDRLRLVGTMYKSPVMYTVMPARDNTKGNNNYDIRTDIVSFSINGPSESILFHGEGVIINFSYKEVTAPVDHVCVFWDQELLKWSASGCRVVQAMSNSNQITCQCQHLTNFAVLMDIHGYLQQDPQQHSGLIYLSITLSVLSCVCLVVTITLLYIYRVQTGPRLMIQQHRSFCLLTLHILVLFTLDRKVLNIEPLACKVLAIILHYICLSVFAWIAIEGVQLYRALVAVFDNGKRYTHIQYLAGYGTPFLVVAITVSISYVSGQEGYGSNSYCWLRPGDYIWTFTGPAAVVTLMNTCVFIMCLHATSATRIQLQKRKKQRIMGNVKTWFILAFLLGITWLFGYMFWDKNTEAFAYIFVILNASNGIFIFVHSCLLNENLKQALRRDAYNSKLMGNMKRGLSSQMSKTSTSVLSNTIKY